MFLLLSLSLFGHSPQTCCIHWLSPGEEERGSTSTGYISFCWCLQCRNRADSLSEAAGGSLTKCLIYFSWPRHKIILHSLSLSCVTFLFFQTTHHMPVSLLLPTPTPPMSLKEEICLSILKQFPVRHFGYPNLNLVFSFLEDDLEKEGHVLIAHST